MTALLLSRDGDVLAWGYEALRIRDEEQADRCDKGWPYYHGFKMRLARDAPRLHASGGADEPVERLIVKYLRCLYRYALEHLAASGYEESDIRWYVTVRPSGVTTRRP